MIVNPIVVSAGGKAKKDPGLKVDKTSVTISNSGYDSAQAVTVSRSGTGKIYPSLDGKLYGVFMDGMKVMVAKYTGEYPMTDPTLTILLEETDEYAAAKVEVKVIYSGAGWGGG